MNVKTIFCGALVALLAFSVMSFADEPRQIDNFGPIQIRIIQADGAEIPAVASTAHASGGKNAVAFEFKGEQIVVRSALEPTSKTVVYRVESKLLQDGTIGIGFESTEKRLPTVNVEDKRVSMKFFRKQAQLGWTGQAAFTKIQPRERLKIDLAEYGATDRWKDVTSMVNDELKGDSVHVRISNVFFGGDPAPGVVKNLVLTYTLGDEDFVKTFTENSVISIQYNPKDRFFRLIPKGSDSFEFVLGVGDKLPDTLPDYKTAAQAVQTDHQKNHNFIVW